MQESLCYFRCTICILIKIKCIIEMNVNKWPWTCLREKSVMDVANLSSFWLSVEKFSKNWVPRICTQHTGTRYVRTWYGTLASDMGHWQVMWDTGTRFGTQVHDLGHRYMMWDTGTWCGTQVHDVGNRKWNIHGNKTCGWILMLLLTLQQCYHQPF